ncbi:HAD family phosphatase [Eubacterium ventriosum]|uniref:HAD family phosphatase n=1 Tax=Eubacterium ventriosum TaxID=39496 RepID=A0A413T7Y8_9FIRM|nr:HAD family phosphatase [Eubacterium ventriosum]
MNIPKVAIFDMDGLIFNTERQFFKFESMVHKKYGYPSRIEDFTQTLGLSFASVKEVHKKIFGEDFSTEQIFKETRELVAKDVEENGLEIMKGIPELLEFFKGNGTICCVASSTVTPMVEKYLNIAGIRDYFKHIIGGDQVKISKPNPEIFLKALGKTPFNKDEAVIFEDSETESEPHTQPAFLLSAFLI